MASLEEALLVSAIESLNIENYWPTFDSAGLEADDDSEYSIILLFYENLLDNLMSRYSVRGNDVKSAIKYLVANYRNLYYGRTPDNLDYNRLGNCLGYLHRYAACHTALVLSVMLRVFHKTPPAVVRRTLALKDQLNVVSLGGGPGNDLLGFLSALYGKHYGLLSLDITVMDDMEGWEPIFLETIKRLRLEECGNVSKIFKETNVTTSFLLGDLKTTAWSANLKRKILQADFLLLCKVLSAIPKEHRNSILRGIVTSMKPGALLVFMDCPFPTAEFKNLEMHLDMAYETYKEKFNFNFQVERFGYTNITACTAYVRIFVKK